VLVSKAALNCPNSVYLFLIGLHISLTGFHLKSKSKPRRSRPI
jgi:hypothetical protein